MKYAAFQAFLHLKRKKLLSAIMILSFFLGFLSLYLGVSYGEEALYMTKTLKLKQEGLITSFYKDNAKLQSQAISRDSIDDFLSDYSFTNDYTCVTNVDYTETSSGYRKYFQMIDLEFINYYNFYLTDGVFFAEKDFVDIPTVCIAEEGTNNNVGDIIKIGSQSYTVVGIIKSSIFRGQLLVPQSKIYDAFTIGFTVTIAGNENELNQINWKTPYLTKLSSEGTTQYTKGMLQALMPLFYKIMIVCFVFFIYMLFNIFNILKNKAVEDAKSFGIRMAIGARNKDILHQFQFETLILMINANLLIVCIDPLISPLIKTVFEHRFNALTISILVCGSIISSYILTKIVFKNFNKKTAFALMREGI